MGKIHYIILSDSLQYSVGCVKEDLCILIGLWLNPFTFQDSPERFRNVQLWGIWRKIKTNNPLSAHSSRFSLTFLPR